MRVEDVCCNVWPVLIFFLDTATICNIIYLIRPSLYLRLSFFFFFVCSMWVCHLWQLSVALIGRFYVDHKGSPKSHRLVLFSNFRKVAVAAELFAASQQAARMWWKTTSEGVKSPAVFFPFWEFSTSQLSWWLLTECRKCYQVVDAWKLRQITDKGSWSLWRWFRCNLARNVDAWYYVVMAPWTPWSVTLCFCFFRATLQAFEIIL